VHAGKFYQQHNEEAYPPVESIKVLSHNIRAFGLNGPKFQTEDGNKIFKFLDEELYDIYCFQEFFSTTRKGFSPYDSVTKYTGVKYKHTEFLVEFRGNFFGIATLSRYPIVDKGLVQFNRLGTNMCIYTDIDIDGKVVRVYNMHLQSLSFREKDVEFLKSMEFDQEETIEGTKNIFSRFQSSFEKREDQAHIIREHIDNCPYPVLICGDFNDTPLSYSYATIKGEFKDAFEEKGKGLGSTYNGIFPLLRIDYMLYNKGLTLHQFDKKKKDLSDHYPLAAYFTFDSQND
jgi:endonuclease/exonuclease/phosphatase family metal-dependent hydrolase